VLDNAAINIVNFQNFPPIYLLEFMIIDVLRHLKSQGVKLLLFMCFSFSVFVRKPLCNLWILFEQTSCCEFRHSGGLTILCRLKL
jgi:hypothetical protein